MDIEQYHELLKKKEVRAYLAGCKKGKDYIDKYLYFINHSEYGKNCKYAVSCIKLMKEDIDGYSPR